MKSSTGIDPDKLQKICSLFSKYPNIQEVLLFGSRAKGNYRNGSDIDLALKGGDLTSRLLTQIELDYDALYFPWKINLVVYSTISNQALKEHIDRVGICIYSQVESHSK